MLKYLILSIKGDRKMFVLINKKNEHSIKTLLMQGRKDLKNLLYYSFSELIFNIHKFLKNYGFLITKNKIFEKG